MNMQAYCPQCGEEREIEVREEKESYPVKNEQIEVDAKVTYCKHCGEQIWNKELDDANLREAYRQYRSVHGLLQPEEIKGIREKYSLTQISFGKILGFGEKTIARYETGSLQDEAYNNLLVLASYPDVFEVLISKNANSISGAEYERAMNALKSLRPQVISGSESISYRPEQTRYQYKIGSTYFGGLWNGRAAGQ